jgi:hypothetical protein
MQSDMIRRLNHINHPNMDVACLVGLVVCVILYALT